MERSTWAQETLERSLSQFLAACRCPGSRSQCASPCARRASQTWKTVHFRVPCSVSRLDRIASAVFTDGRGKICVVVVLAESFVSGSCGIEVSSHMDVGLRNHARECNGGLGHL